MTRFRWPSAMLVLALLPACAGSAGPADASPDPGDAALQDAAAPDAADPGRDDAWPADPSPEAARDDGGADPDAGGADTPPWGWISVIEINDAWDGWFFVTQWIGGVRAYFARAPSWPRSLFHTLEFTRVRATEGACALHDSGLMDEGCEDCFCLDKGIECSQADGSRWCGEDEWCVAGPERPETWPDRGVCTPLPAHFDAGKITLTGLKTGGPLVLSPDALDRYLAPAADLPDPDDLFDAGDTVTAKTGGGDLPAMTFTARGVAPLELDDQTLEVREGQPLVVRWRPADPGTRVQVILRAGSHEPYPLSGAIVCDVEDEAGEVEIAAGLLADLHTLGCKGAYMYKSHRITRYTRDGDRIHLFVGSARNLLVAWP